MAKDVKMRKALPKILARARASARKKNVPLKLNLEELEAAWAAQDGRCAISGITFDDRRYEAAFVKYPFGPSIDRIEPHQGYVPGNIRLLCTAANFARNQWGDDVLRQIAHGIVETERIDERGWFKAQRRKLRQAKRRAEKLTGEELQKQKQVIAGLKRALTMGPARLRGAASIARKTRAKEES